ASVLAVAAGAGIFFFLSHRAAFTAVLGGALTFTMLLIPVWLPTERIASGVRFAAKVLTGLPSILAGVFAYELVVLTT
ncbi:hypothetical protein ABTQ08_22495, partial [Acinetobacter baumannii]